MGINDTSADEVFTYIVKDITDVPAGTDLSTLPALLSGTATIPADSATPVASIPTHGMDDRFLYVEWSDSHGTHPTHFILEPQHLDYATYLRALSLCGFDQFQGF